MLPKSVTTAQKHSRTQANFYSESKSAGLGGILSENKSDNGGWGTSLALPQRDENDPKTNSPMISSPNLEIPHLNNY